MDDIKEQAVKAIQNVTWIPGWGQDRITSMVQDRNDWCISRQRRWGVPIPIFYCKECGEPLISEEAMAAVSEMFRTEGSDQWYVKPAEEIIPEGIACKNAAAHTLIKKKILWTFGSIQALPTLRFWIKDQIYIGLLTSIWRVPTNIAVGSNPLY